MLPARFEPDMLKLVDDPAVPCVVEATVTVPPGAVMFGVLSVPDTAWFTVAALGSTLR